MASIDKTHWPRAVVLASLSGIAATLVMAGLIVLGSRRLSHFDAALVGYTFATLFATFGIVYRYAMWLQRPPTAMYWKRGWQVFLRPQSLPRNLALWIATVGFSILRQQLHLETRADACGGSLADHVGMPHRLGDHVSLWSLAGSISSSPAMGLTTTRANVFGFPLFSLRHRIRCLGYLIFHGLVWASFLVIAGVMLAMRRRMRARDALALQRFGEDFLPLILLFAVSVTGLMLVVSYEWLNGYAYEFLSITHAVTVILHACCGCRSASSFICFSGRPSWACCSIRTPAHAASKHSALCCQEAIRIANACGGLDRGRAAVGIPIRNDRRPHGPLPVDLPPLPTNIVGVGPGAALDTQRRDNES